MRPTTATDNVFDFQALLHPGTVFEHPKSTARPELPMRSRTPETVPDAMSAISILLRSARI